MDAQALEIKEDLIVRGSRCECINEDYSFTRQQNVACEGKCKTYFNMVSQLMREI